MNQHSVDCFMLLAKKQLVEMKRFADRLCKAVKRAPAGRLRITKSNGCVQYYHVKDNPPGVYLSSDRFNFAKSLAQKNYDSKVLREVHSCVSALEHFVESFLPEEILKVYDSLNPDRKRLVDSRIQSDEAFAAEWLKMDYKSLKFDSDDIELYTSSGIRVRSKSEVIIAEVLERLKIPFRYEFPLKMKGGVCIHPDFVCLNVQTREEILWEHFGLMDNPDYVENFVLKLHSYAKNGFVMGKNLIFTVENRNHPLSSREVEALARAFLL